MAVRTKERRNCSIELVLTKFILLTMQVLLWHRAVWDS